MPHGGAWNDNGSGVARQKAEGRNASSAQELLSTFEQRATSARYILDATKNWHRKHPLCLSEIKFAHTDDEVRQEMA
jgi:hypothetical protein